MLVAGEGPGEDLGAAAVAVVLVQSSPSERAHERTGRRKAFFEWGAVPSRA